MAGTNEEKQAPTKRNDICQCMWLAFIDEDVQEVSGIVTYHVMGRELASYRCFHAGSYGCPMVGGRMTTTWDDKSF